MNKYVSKKLVAEGMRQLRVVGLIAAIIAVLITFFTVYAIHVDEKESYEYAILHAQKTGNVVEFEQHVAEVEGAWSCVSVKIAAYLLAPLMTLIIFSFLNKRNASDFYHAISSRRECIAISFSLAVFLWCLLVMLSSFVVAVVTIGLFSHVCFAEYFFSSMVVYFLEAFAITIYLIGLFLLSTSLSGTLLTNLAVSAMILFLPKVLYFSMMGLVVENIDIYPFAYDDSFLSGRYNLVTGVINQVLFGGMEDSTPLLSILYTFAMGLILFVAGCVAFKLRKSEAATQAAANGKLQLVFRLIPAFVVTIIPCAYFYQAICDGEVLGESGMVGIAVCYIIAIIIYFLYEIITTRKWRNIKNAMPGLLILAVLDVCFVGAMLAQREIILRDTPENTSYVRILGNGMSDMNATSYFKVRMGEFEITDATAIRYLEEALVDNIQDIREDSSDYHQGNRLLVEFDENGRKLYRLVFVSDYEYNYINRVIKENNTAQIITDIAAFPYKNVYTYTGLDFSDHEAKKLLEGYMASVPQMDEDEISKIIFSQSNYNQRIDMINVNVQYKGKDYVVSLPILYSMDFVDEYITFRNQMEGNAAPLEEAVKGFKTYKGTENEWMSLQVEYMEAYTMSNNKGTGYNQEHYCYLDEEATKEKMEAMKEMAELLKLASGSTFEEGKSYVKVTYTYSRENKETKEYTRIYVLEDWMRSSVVESMITIAQ